MALGTKNKGKEKEDAFAATAAAARAASDAAIGKAAVEDPLLAARRARVMALDQWERGVDAEGKAVPIDIGKMPGGGVNIALFEDALKRHDKGRVGQGYGSMADGANPNFVAALDKENEMDADLARKGALEGYVGDTLAGNKAEMYGLGGAGDARNMQVAGMREGRYQNDQQRYYDYMKYRESKPNFFKDLAKQWLSPQGVATALTGGSVGGFGHP